MRRTCLRAVLVTLIVTALAPAALAQYPVFNGSFGRDLRGWDQEGVPVAWSDRDFDGHPNSGSALVVNNAGADNGQGIFQCLSGFTFTPGTAMSIAARIHLPTGQTNTGVAAVGLNWFGATGCQAQLGVGGPRAEATSPSGGFTPVSAAFTVPDGAVSAELVVYVTKHEETGSLLAYFDDVELHPLGGPIPLTAIYVPAAAHVFGAADTAWRTDLVVHNPTGSAVQTYLELLERGRTNASPRRAVFMVPPGATVSYADAVGAWFHVDGAVALRVVPQSPESSTIVVSSRTYNLTTEGSYGQYIPGVPEDEATVYGRKVRLLQLSQSTSMTSGYRTNVGLVSAVGMPIEVDIQLFAADGAPLGTKTVTVPAFAFMQFDRIFTEVTAAEVANGFAVLETPTPGGRFIAYASVIDNATGDAICVQPSQL